MLVSNDGNTAFSSTPARKLTETEAQLERLLSAPGTPSGATAADIRRLETLRAGWKAEADRLTIERWTYHQRGRRIHQYLGDKHRRQIEAMQFEYVAAVRRAQALGRGARERAIHGVLEERQWCCAGSVRATNRGLGGSAS